MKKIRKHIRKTPTLNCHVVGDFVVDNSITNDTEMEQVKHKLFEIIQREHYWGELRPSSWMPLEKEIISKREEGTRILTLDEIKKMNSDIYIKLESDDEIDGFLRFHNSLGNLMFFGGTDSKDLVILDPQWLIDSLKQIITHKHFYAIPEGLEQQWQDFMESGRLHKNLIEAVWSRNKDKTFIQHKDKILEILESTDIVCSPKVYSADGKLQQQDYILVPSMLKPNQQALSFVKKAVARFQEKTPTLCFVFKDNFMPPAVFSRVQTACAKEFRIREVSGNRYLFYKVGIFQLNKTHDFLLQQFQHTIRITIGITEPGSVNPHICEAVMTFLEENLRQITQLYHESGIKSNLLFEKTIQCYAAKKSLEALLPLDNLASTHLCRKHWPPWRWHVLRPKMLLRKWSIDKVRYFFFLQST